MARTVRGMGALLVFGCVHPTRSDASLWPEGPVRRWRFVVDAQSGDAPAQRRRIVGRPSTRLRPLAVRPHIACAPRRLRAVRGTPSRWRIGMRAAAQIAARDREPARRFTTRGTRIPSPFNPLSGRSTALPHQNPHSLLTPENVIAIVAAHFEPSGLTGELTSPPSTSEVSISIVAAG